MKKYLIPGCQVSTPGRYEYHFLDDLNCGMSCGQQEYIIFNVKTANDAHIALRDSKNNDKSIEIVIGGWGNSQSVIRSEAQGRNLAEYKQNGLLHGNQFRSFWVSWAGGNIKVGTGSKVGQNTFMEQQISQTINHVGVSGWNVPAEWRFPECSGNYCT